MPSFIAPLLGRLLLVPIALSGVCLTMLFGAPMARAMEPASEIISSVQTVDDATGTMMDASGQAERPACCANVRSEHEVKATPSNELAKTVAAVVADLPAVTMRFPIAVSSSVGVPPDRPKFSQIPLIGITIKRE